MDTLPLPSKIFVPKKETKKNCLSEKVLKEAYPDLNDIAVKNVLFADYAYNQAVTNYTGFMIINDENGTHVYPVSNDEEKLLAEYPNLVIWGKKAQA